MELNFENVIRSIQRNFTGVSLYDAMNATDEILAMRPADSAPDYSTHEGRVRAAIASVDVKDALRDGKKIHAIKHLRTIAGCGLKEAKDAVDDYRVDVFYNRPNY